MQAFKEVADSPFKEAAGSGQGPLEPMAVAVHPDMRNRGVASMTDRRKATGDDEERRGQEQGCASDSSSQPSVEDDQGEEDEEQQQYDFRRTASNEFRSLFVLSHPAKGIHVMKNRNAVPTDEGRVHDVIHKGLSRHLVAVLPTYTECAAKLDCDVLFVSSPPFAFSPGKQWQMRLQKERVLFERSRCTCTFTPPATRLKRRARSRRQRWSNCANNLTSECATLLEEVERGGKEKGRGGRHCMFWCSFDCGWVCLFGLRMEGWMGVGQPD